MSKNHPPLLVIAGTLVLGACTALQESEPPIAAAPQYAPRADADDIARELANPISTLGRMALRLDYVQFEGDFPDADDQSSTVLLFQPSLPYPHESGMNFFIRPAVPIIIDRPVFDGTDFSGEGVELGDISFDFAGGIVDAEGLVLLGGVVFTMPTATQDDFGKNQWSLGPEFLAGRLTDWGFYGLLVTHQWDIADTSSSAEDVNLTSGQYIYTYLLSDGWAIGAGPSWSYDWEADSDDRLTLPVGTGVSRTMVFGTTPVKFSLEFNYYVEQPDAFGPEWGVRLTMTPIVSLPW